MESNPKTELKDLNEDCLRLIFNQLHVTSLFSLAKTSKYFDIIVEDVIKRRLSKRMVVFSMLHPSKSPYLIFEENKESVKVRYVEAAIEFLKKFSQYIRNLKIKDILPRRHMPRRLNEVYRLIHEHCSETLTEFQYEWMNDNFFDFITIPFTNVQTVSMTGNVFSSSINLDFQQMFPVIRILHLNWVRIQNTSKITLEYPHLETLYIEIHTDSSDDTVNEPVVIDLIRKNPQIQSISLKNVHSNLLQIVSETLINLEQLTVDSYLEAKSTAKIHFEQMKSFKISNGFFRSMISNISFGEHLEEFEVIAHFRDHKYIDFIEKNRNLKKIFVYGPFGLLDNHDIQRLAAADLNVTEMSISFDIDIEGENLVQLVNNCKQLKQLHLTMIPTNQFTSFKPEIKEIISMLSKEFENRFVLNRYENEIILTKNVIF